MYLGAIDLNYLSLPAGSVISLGDNTWLSDAVETGLVEYDKTLLLKNSLLYSYTTKLMQSLLIAAVCAAMSIQGRKLIFKLALHASMTPAREVGEIFMISFSSTRTICAWSSCERQWMPL